MVTLFWHKAIIKGHAFRIEMYHCIKIIFLKIAPIRYDHNFVIFLYSYILLESLNHYIREKIFFDSGIGSLSCKRNDRIQISSNIPVGENKHNHWFQHSIL